MDEEKAVVSQEMDEENAATSQEEVAQKVQEQAQDVQTTEVEPDKKSKKGLLIGIIVVAIVIIAAVVIQFWGKGGISASEESNAGPIAIVAKMTDDGTAYIPLYDGTSIVINDEVQSAILTKDQEHIVVLLKDGTLYVTDKNLSEKNTITDNCDEIDSVRNDGFFYADEDGSIYRILFDDYSSVNLEGFITGTVAANNTTVLYATGDGRIYVMKSNSAEGTRIGTYNGSIDLETVSDDGQLSLWVTEEDDIQTIIINDGDDKTTLGDVDYKYNYTYATFSADQKTIVVSNSYSDEIWIKTIGEDPVTVKLGANPESSVIYTENGMMDNEDSSDVTGIYISIEGDTDTNLYYISMNGDRERVLSKILDYTIADEKIFYTDEDGSLYSADIHGSEVSNDAKIASDVSMFTMTANGKFIYYVKDYDDGVANLYCYKVGDEEPVKIASDIACYYIYEIKLMNITCSTDGATVFFYKDEEGIGDTYSSCGTLMKWSYGNESAEKVASEAILYSVSGELDSGEVDPNSIMYMKYTYVDEDENIFANWMYFDGTESVKVATDIIK